MKKNVRKKSKSSRQNHQMRFRHPSLKRWMYWWATGSVYVKEPTPWYARRNHWEWTVPYILTHLPF